MTSTPIALIGAGPWGRTIAAAISATPGVSLAAVVSSSAQTGQTIDFGIPVFEDWRTAIDSTGASGVVLALPPMHQPKFAVELIEHGIPVMLEKPMSASVAGANAIRTAAGKHGFTGLVNHLHLYAPAFRKLLIEISSLTGTRTVRAVAGARGPWRGDWNPLWDWAGHDLAMALSAIDAEPVKISAHADAPIIAQNLRYQNFHIDLAFRDGSRALLHLGNAFEHKIREFYVSADGGSGCYRETELGETSLSIDGSDPGVICAGVESRPLNAALISFAARIRTGGSIEDIEMGALVVELIEAAERSIQSGVPISTGKGGYS
jgi:predicted dehydrogenase